MVAGNTRNMLLCSKGGRIAVPTLGMRAMSAANTKSAFGNTLTITLSRNGSLGDTYRFTMGTTTLSIAGLNTRSKVPDHSRIGELRRG